MNWTMIRPSTTKPTGELVVQSDSPDLEFAFSDDRSGVLAALGLGTFFFWFEGG